MAFKFRGKEIFKPLNTGVNAEVKMAGNKTKSFFSLDKPKEELEGWSGRIVNVAERDYIDGYLKGGWRKSIVTRVFAWVMRTFHMSFMIHAEFRLYFLMDLIDHAVFQQDGKIIRIFEN